MPDGGSAGSLSPGQPFTTAFGGQSRRVSSWLLGDGTVLANDALQDMGFTSAVTPLDSVVFGRAFEARSGGTAGFRIGRQLSSRISAEFTMDFSRVRPKMIPQALADAEATRASFIPAFNDLVRDPIIENVEVTSVTTVLDPGAEILSTGVLSYALKSDGRMIPYVSGGAGLVSFLGDEPGLMLEAHYQFDVVGSSFDETDTVVVRSVAPGFVGVVGGGVRYYLSSRWGLRGDLRVYFGGSPETQVDLTPSFVAATLAGGLVIASDSDPSIQFSNGPQTQGIPRSSLAGPEVRELVTFSGSGSMVKSALTVGSFWRF